MRHSVVAYDDRTLIDWMLELIEEGSPGFLAFLAEAAILASPGEYAILRPSLLLLKRRHVHAHMTMRAKATRRVRTMRIAQPAVKRERRP